MRCLPTEIPMTKRTHHCAQLNKTHLGATVSLVGWVDSDSRPRRIIFVDLRDREGITQVKLEPHENAQLGEQLKHLKPESVIGVTGLVAHRPPGTENPGLPTGDVEVDATRAGNLQHFRDAAVSLETTKR